ncbi:MAG: 2-methylaconitate cis-trans isomerase PrpF family protein [Gammaproteobacteria bacterium]|nr:2-methylaconitate cis-trans isomerase PrpF family protein [Gammaproteobacteria bacterium]MDH3413952.1 2-methylaconitate cis-trans isomerase PrpF family protein [Gammaproteobacteria bacterium]
MKQLKIPAVFMRGGTSNAIVFKQQDLPADRALWPEIFLAAQGSPDPFGRQLNGMGGGISSLSKICVIGPPSRADADIDYTFAQIGVRDASVSFASNCGNMSSAMAPFAVDEGLVKVSGAKATVRIHNTNTNKIIVSYFDLDEGLAAVDGDYVMSGVAEPGAKVRLDFLEPGGAITGKLLPTGKAMDILDVPGLGQVEASVVDAAMAGVFVDASALGLEGTELPEEIDARAKVMDKLEALRREAGFRAGIADSPEAMAKQPAAISSGIVSGPRDAPSLSGETIPASGGDLVVRIVSNGNTHRALPATGSVCAAVAARIGASVVHRAARKTDDPGSDIRMVHPSGMMVLAASVQKRPDGWYAESGTLYRTQRRLFEGFVYVPASKVPGFVELKKPRSSAAD